MEGRRIGVAMSPAWTESTASLTGLDCAIGMHVHNLREDDDFGIIYGTPLDSNGCALSELLYRHTGCMYGA